MWLLLFAFSSSAQDQTPALMHAIYHWATTPWLAVRACAWVKRQRSGVALSVSPQALTTFDFENSLTSPELGKWLRLAGQRTTGFSISPALELQAHVAKPGIFKIWGLKIKLGVLIVIKRDPCWLSFHCVYCYCGGKLDGRLLYSLQQYDSIIFTNFKVTGKNLHP